MRLLETVRSATDEVDSFLGIRRDTEHEATTGIKNEFMQLWDGFNTRAEQRVVVLGATNRPYAIDPAALRRHASFSLPCLLTPRPWSDACSM